MQKNLFSLLYLIITSTLIVFFIYRVMVMQSQIEELAQNYQTATEKIKEPNTEDMHRITKLEDCEKATTSFITFYNLASEYFVDRPTICAEEYLATNDAQSLSDSNNFSCKFLRGSWPDPESRKGFYKERVMNTGTNDVDVANEYFNQLKEARKNYLQAIEVCPEYLLK